jgi:methyl-accepting chemotaxis protein
MQGMQMQQVIDVVVTVNGKDENFQDVPLNVEIAQKGNSTFSGSREAMLQAVDGMLQASRKALEQTDYHQSVIAESEKMMEVLNPQYAENKQQARTIKDLQERADKQDKKLDDIYSLLKKMSGTPTKT